MKVIYVNENRHERVLRAVSNPDNENIYIIPKDVDYIVGKKYLKTVFKKIYPNHQFNFIYRLILALEIRRIAKEEKPDIIHFVSADDYIKLCGIGLGLLSKFNLVATLHWCNHTFKSDFSRNRLKKLFKGIIFHVKSEPIYKNKYGEEKSCFFVLPPENIGEIYSKNDARKYLGLDYNDKIYCFIGYMEEYKGVDILMNSLRNIENKITLLLVGKPGKYTREYFESFQNNNVNIIMNLEYVTDEDFTYYVCASDYVVLPYRKEFQATSGPMTEAVRCGVPIIAPNYGNLGDLTKSYELGYTFEIENSRSLAETIDKSTKSDFKKSEKYNLYRRMLEPSYYREQQQKFYEKIIKNRC